MTTYFPLLNYYIISFQKPRLCGGRDDPCRCPCFEHLKFNFCNNTIGETLSRYLQFLDIFLKCIVFLVNIMYFLKQLQLQIIIHAIHQQFLLKTYRNVNIVSIIRIMLSRVCYLRCLWGLGVIIFGWNRNKLKGVIAG